MILGFAHITRNRPEQGLLAIPNAPEKWPLMTRQAAWHWLALRRNGIVQEVVEYDTGLVDRPGRLDVGDQVIRLSARDEHAEIGWFRDGLGFDAEGAPFMQFRSQLPHWGVNIVVERDESAPLDPPLDIHGYAALAFYSNDVEADRDHLLKHGGRTPTDPFTVKVSDREMKIIMLRSPEGTIIELIEVRP
jgi:hypothetical protein